jgi:2-aminoadipate transaminase
LIMLTQKYLAPVEKSTGAFAFVAACSQYLPIRKLKTDKTMNELLKQIADARQHEGIFADRISDVPRSFIREILKVAISSDIISFAGGLPNRELFPVEALKQAAVRVFDDAGKEALQYSNSEGYLPLREYIAERYLQKMGIRISPENILILSGSQQGLDLLGKVMLNCGDEVIMEEPGYLGAIQAFSCYRPKFLPVRLNSDGINIIELARSLKDHDPKLMYTVPAFQNPSGISYSYAVREEVVRLLSGRRLYLVEDNPYIDIRFKDNSQSTFYSLLPEHTILLGTFSKTAVPGFRLGWIVAPDAIMEKLIVTKQASDLHTNNFIQRLLYDYLMHNDIEQHIRLICDVYGRQCNAMLCAMEQYFPAGIEYTCPDGGMFLWVTLPEHLSSMKLFDIAIRKNVAFVPGNPFYTDNRDSCSTLRLNFSCAGVDTIHDGIQRLGSSINELMASC